MRTEHSLVAAIVMLLAVVVPGRAETGYAFELEGKPLDPSVRSLGDGSEKVEKGDLVVIGGIAMTLEEPGRYRFAVEHRKESKERLLYRRGEGTKRTLVGVALEDVYSDDPKPEPSILMELSELELGEIRGLALERWDAEIAGKVADLDLTRVVLTLEDDMLDGGSLAELPEGVTGLILRTSSSNTKWDYASLGKQTQLRMLDLDGFGNLRCEIAPILASRELRYLGGAGLALASPGPLAELVELRNLDLSWNDSLVDIGFASKLLKLRKLDVTSTGVTDLTPLEGLAKLEEIEANGAPVSKLPEGGLAGLKTIRLMTTALGKKAVAAFAESHPEAEIWFDWRVALRRAAEGVTRLRIRSGGTCHRDPASEKTLAEIGDAAEIEQLLSNIQMAGDPDGGHCMCCGDPSFEFYRGDALILTLGFHHGRSLRWREGWPSDGLIDEASADYLCHFLDRYGVKKPLQALEEARQSQRALGRRYRRYEELIPEPLLEVLRNGGGAEAFGDKIADAEERALLCFRLFGCHQDSWNLAAGIDGMLEETLLPEVDPDLFGMGLLPKASEDEELRNGLARWIFDQGNWKTFDAAFLGEHLGMLAEYGLAHPREESWHRTLNALNQMEGEAVVAVLRRCLAGGIAPRVLAPELLAEPGGSMSFSPGTVDLPAGAEARVGAALVLATKGDTESLDAIEKLADESKDTGVVEALRKAARELRP